MTEHNLNTVVVGIGSNINPKDNIEKAKNYISSDHKLLKSSNFIKTKPIGYKNQDDFLNGALLVKTALCLETFKDYLKNIENNLGRHRTDNKNGPRTIDLDILLWNGDVVNVDYYEREFLQKVVNDLI